MELVDIGDYYQIYSSTEKEGPFEPLFQSLRREMSETRISDLTVDQIYYFKIRTVTLPHHLNHNTVTSDFSSPIRVNTGPLSRLYFPVFQRDGSGGSTGIAVSNASALDAFTELTAYDEQGVAIDQIPHPVYNRNPASFFIKPGHQLARLGREIFGLAETGSVNAWIEMSTDNPDIGSFFMLGGPGRLDGASVLDTQWKTLYFIRVYEGPEALRGQEAHSYLSLVIRTISRSPSGSCSSAAKPMQTLQQR